MTILVDDYINSRLLQYLKQLARICFLVQSIKIDKKLNKNQLIIPSVSIQNITCLMLTLGLYRWRFLHKLRKYTYFPVRRPDMYALFTELSK